MKKLIIAGNAPSLRSIDYARMPEDFEVFRCNQFYFENEYYLGKKIKAVFFNTQAFFQSYYTLKTLVANEEYEIEDIYLLNYGLAHIEDECFIKSFKAYFPDAKLGYDTLKLLREFDTFIKLKELYYDQRITSGIYMCAIAVALGYKDIFLAGIDFYNTNTYAFDNTKPNLLKLAPSFKSAIKSNNHSQQMDLKALEFLMQQGGGD